MLIQILQPAPANDATQRIGNRRRKDKTRPAQAERTQIRDKRAIPKAARCTGHDYVVYRIGVEIQAERIAPDASKNPVLRQARLCQQEAASIDRVAACERTRRVQEFSGKEKCALGRLPHDFNERHREKRAGA